MENAIEKTGAKVLGKSRGKLMVERKDGLKVFLDGDFDPVLDPIRLNAKNKKTVILATAVRRAQIIAINYAEKYAPEEAEEIKKMVTSGELFSMISQSLLSPPECKTLMGGIEDEI